MKDYSHIPKEDLEKILELINNHFKEKNFKLEDVEAVTQMKVGTPLKEKINLVIIS